ncbi:MAG: hypothetical protein AB8B69_09510, partial [Chitinophagales bacterium]
MTINEAILQTLEDVKKAMLSKEVYEHIITNNYCDFINAKTPSSTISALLGNFIRDEDNRIKRFKTSSGSFRYYLAKYKNELEFFNRMPNIFDVFKVDYSWVKTHLDIVEYLKNKKGNQKELVGLLKSLGIKSLIDEDENGKKELEVIDPFTFFCYIHKHGDKNRLDFLIQLAEKLNLTIPTAVKGLPTVNAQKVCLFPFEKGRVGN